MRLLDVMKDLIHAYEPDKEPDKPVDIEEDGKILYRQDVIAFVEEELEKRKRERSALEQQWTLNANFLVGNQYCEISTYRDNAIEQLEPVYDWLERETFNQIAPLIETRVANLKKLNYLMRVKPATNELSDYDKAETSTAILQHVQKVSDFDTKKNTMIYWNELCGNAFWLSWWDKSGGEQLASETIFSVDEEGVQHKKEVGIFEGEIDYGLITPYEVFPESIFKQTVEAQRSIILDQVKTVDEIRDLYGVEIEGSEVETFELTPVGSGGGFGYESTVMTIGHRSMANAARLRTYFERPSTFRPNGRMIIIAGDKLVYYGNLPYKKIPIVQVVCRELPGQFFGKSVIEDLIPRQRAYNGCINRIHEFIKRIAIGNLAVKEGSIDIEEYEQNGLAPGAFLVYKDGESPPIPLPNGNLPAEIMQERYNLKADMEYAAGVSQLMVNGATPSGVTSGAAIDSLVEIDNTRLSLTGDHIRNSVRKLAITWLEIYKMYASTRRIIHYVGTNNIGRAIMWSANDINSYDVEYTTENELLQSEDAQREKFLQSFQMGLFTDDDGRIPARAKIRALECMRVNNYTELMSIDLLEIQAAQNENVFFETGSLPEVSEFDNHDIHVEEHLRYIKQMDFQILKLKRPNYAKALEDHIRLHKEMKRQQAAEEMAAMQGMMQGVMPQ